MRASFQLSVALVSMSLASVASAQRARPPEPIAVDAGAAFACALMRDGTVHCWGDNAQGQCGDGTTEARPTPVRVTGIQGAVEIAVGEAHACARLGSGEVRCWGANQAGQLGNGQTSSAPTPVTVQGLADASAIGLGAHHSCAVRADGGRVVCWGDNTMFAVGGSGTGPHLAPYEIPGLANAVEIGGGQSHTCARVSDGTIQCWGFARNGELGDGRTTRRNRPGPVDGVTGATALRVGADFACAIVAGGAVRCWGSPAFGQLGGPAGSDVPGLSGVRDLTLGSDAACVVAANRSVSCWGVLWDMPLVPGGTVEGVRAPTPIPGLRSIDAIGSGGHYLCAIGRSGVSCWGRLASRTTGPTTLEQPSPTVIRFVTPPPGATAAP